MKMNKYILEDVQKSLEAYLRVKREAFPRFYFLSNDELLEILAQATRNPKAVEKHLRKCFDAISTLVSKYQKRRERASRNGSTLVIVTLVFISCFLF